MTREVHKDVEAMARALFQATPNSEHYDADELDAFSEKPHWESHIVEALAAWACALDILQEPSEAMIDAACNFTLDDASTIAAWEVMMENKRRELGLEATEASTPARPSP